jgi:hypothetical protein
VISFAIIIANDYLDTALLIILIGVLSLLHRQLHGANIRNVFDNFVQMDNQAYFLYPQVAGIFFDRSRLFVIIICGNPPS